MGAASTVEGWITAEDGLALAGADLDVVYLGPSTSPETIDPSLPVDLDEPDLAARTVSGPPHYGTLSPAARGGYLRWHQGGRRTAQAPSQWPLLLLYGLERRVLVDGDDSTKLANEAADLGRVYGCDPEIRRITDALGPRPRSSSRPPLTEGPMPDSLRVELGRRALGSEPVTTDWALSWAWYHPDIPRGPAAARTPAEFVALWRHRFGERHPEGFLAPPKRRRLTFEYVPANPGLPSPLDLTIHDASDVVDTPGPAHLLRAITDEVETQLAPYVSWLERHPDAAELGPAAAVLPAPLLTGSPAARAAHGLVDHARTTLNDAEAVVADAGPLRAHWRSAGGRGDFGRADSVALAQVLARYGIGIEPDVRFAGRSLGRQDQVVLFRLVDPTATPSEAYAASLVALALCAVVASADGAIDDEESDLLAAQIESAGTLTSGERARLHAHRLMLTTVECDLDDVATRIGLLDEPRRRGLAEHVLEIAWLDGVITEGEARTVRAVYELLGLNPAEADDRLRTSSTVQPPSVVQDSASGLDAERLRATRADNAAVQDLLGAIFADDDTEDDVAEPPIEGPAGGSLDQRHSGLLRELASLGRMGRADMVASAARHGVMADGAIDVINEAALDLTADPVLHVGDDESVTVDHTVYEEMSA